MNEYVIDVNTRFIIKAENYDAAINSLNEILDIAGAESCRETYDRTEEVCS